MNFLNWILYVVPKNLLSFWAGKLMHLKFPSPLRLFLIKLFANHYKINTEEAEKPMDQYLSIGDFFIRKLKDGVRPISSTDYVHPADSKMTARGIIQEGQLVQAKGRVYSLSEFLKLENTTNSNSSSVAWLGGYFITYYLCPTDYHRVHSPVDGWIKEVRYVPGQLWPVNDWSVSNIDQLFIRNERVIVDIQTTLGLVAVVFVGATNVGSIKLSFEPEVQSNHSHLRNSKTWSYREGLCSIKKGQELGMFCMGSTVIVVANKNWKPLDQIVKNQEPVAVRMGSF